MHPQEPMSMPAAACATRISIGFKLQCCRYTYKQATKRHIGLVRTRTQQASLQFVKLLHLLASTHGSCCLHSGSV
jgi:hypothetical protein